MYVVEPFFVCLFVFQGQCALNMTQSYTGVGRRGSDKCSGSFFTNKRIRYYTVQMFIFWHYVVSLLLIDFPVQKIWTPSWPWTFCRGIPVNHLAVSKIEYKYLPYSATEEHIELEQSKLVMNHDEKAVLLYTP